MCGAPLLEISRVPVCRSCFENLPALEPECFCLRCRTPFLNRHPLNAEGLCGLCAAGLTRFDACFAFGSYDGPLRELVHLLKYGGVTPLARRLGALMARALPPGSAFDLVVPMPLHWWRRWRRGFNQAELLGGAVARLLRIPLVRPVRRRKPTASQTGLTSAGRRRNVAGAFRVPEPSLVSGRRVLLVDDVLTTGATANACAAALKHAGARHVAVLTVARADRRLWVRALLSDSANWTRLETSLGGVTP